MQVEAIYNQGRLEFAQPMNLRHGSFKVIVDIPDAEFLSLDEITQTRAEEVTIKKAGATTLSAQLDAILAPYLHLLNKKQAFSPNDYKEMWIDHLEEKYLDRR